MRDHPNVRAAPPGNAIALFVAYHARWMTAAFKRVLALLPDALIVLVLVVPEVVAYARWPLLGLYALISWHVVSKLREKQWIVEIVRDRATRMAHGLEHATMAVLWEDQVPVTHGFTHGTGRFVVALQGAQGHQLAVVRDAAARAIQRIRGGESALAYQPGCGTSEAVSAVSLWLVFVASMVCAHLIGGSTASFVVICLITVRIWLAFQVGLGLLAQRLYTVSTEFSSAVVVDVCEVSRIYNLVCPEDETWFEVVVDIEVAATRGGLVSPGA
jgi:hypothetical protein